MAINTANHSGGPGIGFAIPANVVKLAMADLVSFGRIRPPWLGLGQELSMSATDAERSCDEHLVPCHGRINNYYVGKKLRALLADPQER